MAEEVVEPVEEVLDEHTDDDHDEQDGARHERVGRFEVRTGRHILKQISNTKKNEKKNDIFKMERISGREGKQTR